MSRRWFRAAILAATILLATTAAGCGGGGGGGGESTAAENVSGNVSVMGVWTGAEKDSFTAVLQAFMDKYPDVTVKYTSAGDQLPQQLSTAVEGGNPPDVAFLPQPGLMKDFVNKNALQPLDFMQDDVNSNLGESAVQLGSVDGTLYGFLFKAANKSTVWYNVKAFDDAGVEPARDVGRRDVGGGHDPAVGPPRMVDRRGGRLDAHRPVREHLPPAGRRGHVRPADDPRHPVDRRFRQDGAADDGGRLQEQGQRGRERAPDRLPDVGPAGVLGEPEGRDGRRGRLRPGRRPVAAQAGDGLQRLRRSRRSTGLRRRSWAAGTPPSCSTTRPRPRR